MAFLIPESLRRLQASSFVSGAELSAVGRSAIIRAAAEKMAETAMRKLLEDCIKTEEYMGYQGQTLYLDVYVIAPDELLGLLRDARAQGQRDALQWGQL